MGVNFKNQEFGTVTPQCSCCGVCLCWDIDNNEYAIHQGFWDDWTCRDCNPNYEGAYKLYKGKNKNQLEI